MKVIKITLFVLIAYLLISCAPETYKYFASSNDYVVNSKYKPQRIIDAFPEKNIWTKKNYDKNSYIYIYTGNRVNRKCVWGYLVDKNGDGRAKDWKVLSGKKYCKEAQQYNCCM